MNSVSYKVNEIFQSIQGEGVYTGTPSVFIRLQYCPVGCAWCDTKHTWQANESDRCSKENFLKNSKTAEQWCELTIDEILSFYTVNDYKATHIVISGGEPCFYDLRPLIDALEAKGFRCQIETSGTFDINVSDTTWVTVSPKVKMNGKLEVLKSALLRANEIKHPVGTEKDVEQLEALISPLLKDEHWKNPVISLQPISQKVHGTKLCIETCIKNNWTLSLQMHKYINII